MRARIGLASLFGAAGLCVLASNTSAQIETVVVTAQKRVENVQKVPIAISAVEGNSLDKMGVTGFKELQSAVPSLRFGAGVTGGENVITMRGLGSQNTTPGGDSPVAYNVDGVYLQRTTAVDSEFYDVSRVEVLRGPQGTLYGRNSLGGTINVITNKPSDTFSGGIDAAFGDYAMRDFRGWMTGALVDQGDFQILFRLTGVSAEHDPYAKNLSTAPTATHNQDAQHFQMGRGQVLINFNSDVNLLLSASLNQNTDIAAANTAWWEQPERFTGGSDPIPLGSRCDFHTKALYNPRKYCHDAAENASNRLSLYNATLNWHMPWADFTSVTGYGTSAVKQNSDGDGSDQPIALGVPWILRQHQISEEVRLASNNDDQPFKWIAGFYYFWSDNFENFGYQDNGYNDDFSGLYGYPGSYDTFTFLSHGNTSTRSYAPFGQIDYDFGKTSIAIPLTVTAGLRYTDDEKYGYNYLDYRLPYLCPPPNGTCLLAKGPFDKSWSQMTGKFGLNYQFNDNLMGYVSASRGYISGGNIIGLANVYNPESMWSYEAGFKSRFWDDKAQLNVAAYHEEITGLQVFIQSSTQSGINNVDGLTQVNGLETEFTLAPDEHWQFNSTLTLTSAHYGEYITTDNRYGTPPAGCTYGATHTLCNFKGNELNQTPSYTLNLGAQYTFDTDFGTITPRVDTFLSGRVQFLPDNVNPQSSYTKTNIDVAWISKSGKYKAEVFVHNLEDADVISNDGLQSISLGQQILEPDNYVYYPPRTIGVRFGYNFGG
ncbi:MAG TPA: TonB-dependent receptor [Rhizomicrobium sp.]|nr:TonB-dependent receptor [Rhizomicrobium sp.]